MKQLQKITSDIWETTLQCSTSCGEGQSGEAVAARTATTATGAEEKPWSVGSPLCWEPYKSRDSSFPLQLFSNDNKLGNK